MAPAGGPCRTARPGRSRLTPVLEGAPRRGTVTAADSTATTWWLPMTVSRASKGTPADPDGPGQPPARRRARHAECVDCASDATLVTGERWTTGSSWMVVDVPGGQGPATQLRSGDEVIAVDGHGLAGGLSRSARPTDGATVVHQLRSGALRTGTAGRPDVLALLPCSSGDLVFVSAFGLLALALYPRRPAEPAVGPLLIAAAALFGSTRPSPPGCRWWRGPSAARRCGPTRPPPSRSTRSPGAPSSPPPSSWSRATRGCPGDRAPSWPAPTWPRRRRWGSGRRGADVWPGQRGLPQRVGGGALGEDNRSPDRFGHIDAAG